MSKWTVCHLSLHDGMLRTLTLLLVCTDTSIPDQKLGYNSDCEDQAIKVLGVFKKITHASRDLEDTDWWFANHLAKFGREYFDYGVLLTGMACPSVALHSDKPAIDKQIGHAWCALRRNPLKFEGYPVDWAFVEGTAVALSYRPLKSSKFASTSESICHSAFAGKIMLISPPRKLAVLKSSLNFPTLATIDDNMNYLKYVASVDHRKCMIMSSLASTRRKLST